MSERISFSKLKEIISPPNLIQHQIESFESFLQEKIDPFNRELKGLEEIFCELFPIVGNNSECILEYSHYKVADPLYDEIYCLDKGLTYSFSLYLTLKLKEKNNVKEEEIYMGEFPMITKQGSFIINGTERVIVSQLHRSPGIFYESNIHNSGKVLYSFRIIPDRGTWIEIQFDQNDLLYVYLDRKRKRRKFLVTTFLRALGYEKNIEIIKLFYDLKEVYLINYTKNTDYNCFILEDLIHPEKGIILAKSYDILTSEILESLINAGIEKILLIYVKENDDYIINSLRKDYTKNQEEALKDIYKKLRPGEVVNLTNSEKFIKGLFFDNKRYNLGAVGRYKINKKLARNEKIENRLLQKEDIVEAIKKLFNLKNGKENIDDIDHLGNRRVRTVGELIANQCRLGLSRTEKLVKEKMALYNQSVDVLSIQKLINSKSLSTVIRDFFARSQLSQFMDQINPLAELTHKRRLSALGPGGLNRERAGFEVRDVHPSHYGRICPIETPEGPNIGLINSLSTYARINEFGFIETPYIKIKNGLITNQIDYLTAEEEEKYIIAQANSETNEYGKLKGIIIVREKDSVYETNAEKVNYMDVSPKQMVSVSAGIIPFLEHDDANRALMGSNMQKQGVPLLITEAPFVGTGIEKKVAEDSKTVIISEEDGVVSYVDSKKIIVNNNEESINNVYKLKKFIRSNSATCFNQKPIVKKNQIIKKGMVIADGAATDNGELALGRNVLVAFMPWQGYNFEDAILISEKLIKDDTYTSIHIEEFEITARETKLGPEEITRDIPNISEDSLRNLNRNGIIYIGAEVKPGDILVGKITPKSETELAPEEKLLRAIFGEKAADVRDSSLLVPSGVSGIVMDVKITSVASKSQDKMSSVDQKRQVKRINEEYRTHIDKVKDDLTEALSNILLGEKIPLNVWNKRTGELIIPANRKITKTLLRRFASVSKDISIDPSPVKIKIMEIVNSFHKKLEELEQEREDRVKEIEKGNLSESGIIKSVKVYVASKRKIQVGDKMAGRHGNKGVVSKILPVEDMPYLPDGTPIEILLNPLGVPSRMNVGQVLETHLGWACKVLGIKIATPVFDGIKEKEIIDYLKQANLPETGKSKLFDGRTGNLFDQEVVVGYIYMMKLNHLVADKIHARSVGPYSLITQQPLGGKAQYGGQRFGEMEVWALEAYGAAYTLQELLTVKSDDVNGRTKMYESLVKGDNSLHAGTPQSFNVLIKEMQSLCLNVKLEIDEDI